jgi:hypothetical protein
MATSPARPRYSFPTVAELAAYAKQHGHPIPALIVPAPRPVASVPPPAPIRRVA